MTCSDIFLGVIAILFPPIAVWIKSGICTCDSLINILLCMLGYIPGLLHAWYIIAKYPEYDYDHIDDPERQGRVTYYYISHESPSRRGRGNQRQQQLQQHVGPNYGAIPAGAGNKAQPQSNQQQSGVVRTGNNNASGGTRPSGPSAGASSSSNEQGAPPPSYSDAVRGDHKVQSQD